MDMDATDVREELVVFIFNVYDHTVDKRVS